MPNYDYFCTQCKYEEEILQKITDPALKNCPQCKQPSFSRKLGRGIGLQFNGSGFYSTDYGTKSNAPSEKTDTTKAKDGCGCGKTSCSS